MQDKEIQTMVTQTAELTDAGQLVWVSHLSGWEPSFRLDVPEGRLYVQKIQRMGDLLYALRIFNGAGRLVCEVWSEFYGGGPTDIRQAIADVESLWEAAARSASDERKQSCERTLIAVKEAVDAAQSRDDAELDEWIRTWFDENFPGAEGEEVEGVLDETDPVDEPEDDEEDEDELPYDLEVEIIEIEIIEVEFDYLDVELPGEAAEPQEPDELQLAPLPLLRHFGEEQED